MRAKNVANHPPTRIHAIVLTWNRPETLHRCIATALSSLGPQDLLTIIDDSLPTIFPTNATLLEMTPTVPAPTRIHISTMRACEVITQSVSGSYLSWLLKTAQRDIAPLRNLSLLLSTVVQAETTVLIDDDIHGFDLAATHSRINELSQSSKGVIAGAVIRGINEYDTITRLNDAVKMIEKLPAGTKVESIRDLFRTCDTSSSDAGSACRYVSAGYMAFRLPPERIFAFPPGYNEDWLWCILQGGETQERVMCLGESVKHDPPSVRRPTREDLLFELGGDLVFDCFEELYIESELNPETILSRLLEKFPGPDSMPSARVLELLDTVSASNQDENSLIALEEYGLAVLADMLHAGDLDMDWEQFLIDWRDDAIAKHRTVAATLKNEDAIPALQTLLQEGRL